MKERKKVGSGKAMKKNFSVEIDYNQQYFIISYLYNIMVPL